LITYDLITHRPTGSECGLGKYIASGTTFQRNTIYNSTDSDDSAIDLTGLTEIYLGPTALSYNAGFNPFAQYKSPVDEVTILNTAAGTVPIDSATFDDYALGTFVDSDDKITINDAGWYSIFASVGHYSNGSDYNGKIYIGFINGGLVNTGEIRTYATAQVINSDETIISIPMYHATLDDTSFIQIGITNNTGQSIQGYLNHIALIRWKKDS